MFELWVVVPVLLLLDFADPGMEALMGIGVLALGTLSARLVRRLR